LRVDPPAVLWEMRWLPVAAYRLFDSRELKKRILAGILKQIARLKEIPSISLVPSPDPYDYRVRVQLKVKGEVIGYYQEKSIRWWRSTIAPSHILWSIKSSENFERIFHSVTLGGDWDQCVARGRERSACISSSFLWSTDRTFIMEFLQNQPILRGVAIARKGGLNSWVTLLWILGFFWVKREKKEIYVRISSESFSQVNLEQNQNLIQTVLQFSEVNKEDRVSTSMPALETWPSLWHGSKGSLGDRRE